MQLRRSFFLTFSFFLLLWGLAGYSSNKADQIAKIDARIAELEAEKMGYEGRALRHEYQVEYLQFNNQTHLEVRRHIQLADENRAKAERVQEMIDDLKAQRAKLR